MIYSMPSKTLHISDTYESTHQASEIPTFDGYFKNYVHYNCNEISMVRRRGKLPAVK